MLSGLYSNRLITAVSLVWVCLAISLPLFLIRLLIIPPTIDEVIIFVNGRAFANLEDPIHVPLGKVVAVSIRLYDQGEKLNPGDFTYQWCFDPPISDNPYCDLAHYRNETNRDYKPDKSDEQDLNVVISHNVFQTTVVTVTFQPE
ncbi:MAG: hypothetical protein KDJ52_17900 [Anaerolineae bacterium]|nr:hypothetical protein [Anaerolineae bacterium]